MPQNIHFEDSEAFFLSITQARREATARQSATSCGKTACIAIHLA
jgi:hypothetical protein